MDSLTEGAGGTSYREFFCQDSLTESLGYIPIDYNSTKEVGISVYMTGNMKWFPSSLNHDAYPKKFSFDGKGVYSDIASNDKCGFNISKIKNYDEVGLYFLKQPNGGTFSFSLSLEGIKRDSLTVNTSAKYEEIGYVKMDNKKSDRIYIENVSGKIVLFGLYFKPQDKPGRTIVDTFAKGGTKLNDLSKLDKNFRKEWLKVLKPTTFVLNTGMNDRKTIKPAIFKKDLDNFISDIKHGAPKCKIILVEPNESNDYLSTHMSHYRKIRQNISQNTEKCFYYSIPKSIGNYNFFVKNAMMLDKVHPNKKGNEVIGNSLYEFLKKIK